MSSHVPGFGIVAGMNPYSHVFPTYQNSQLYVAGPMVDGLKIKTKEKSNTKFELTETQKNCYHKLVKLIDSSGGLHLLRFDRTLYLQSGI